jgi:hypothetical protein
MASIEERLTAIEQDNTKLKKEHAELKEKIELQTIAIGGLVNKAMLEAINEQNGKIFDTLLNHDKFTNMQLAELRQELQEVDGKVVGLQTEMRQRFNDIEARMATKDDLKAMATKDDLKAMATKDDLKAVDARFNDLEARMATKDDLKAIDARFDAVDARFDAVDARFDQVLTLLSRLTNEPGQE